MFFDGRFRFIGKVDPAPIAAVNDSFGEEAWLEHASRQQMYQMHSQTQSIPLLFDDDGRHTDPTPWPRLAQLSPLLEPVLEQIREANRPAEGGSDNGYFIRIVAALLKPHAFISPHRDGGHSLMRAHRYHVPIRTNEGVEFKIAEELRHLAAGEIWEVNNRRVHAVRNLSDDPRIHLIIDYVVPGEKIPDPEGLCIA